jgi:two-component system, sensor histidine kinase ChiS
MLRYGQISRQGLELGVTPTPLVAVIDDDPEFLDLVRQIIEDEREYRVVTAIQGQGAIDFLLQHRPDVVILDIRLETPRLGAEILRSMRRHARLQHAPVIVCTADHRFLCENEAELRALRSEWLPKPFDIEDLLSKIDRALDSSGSRTSLAE